jgi:hypothetical protein
VPCIGTPLPLHVLRALRAAVTQHGDRAVAKDAEVSAPTIHKALARLPIAPAPRRRLQRYLDRMAAVESGVLP